MKQKVQSIINPEIYYKVKGKNSEIEKEFIDFNNPRKRFWYYLKRWFKNKVRKIKSHF